eukprot:m.231874 g.231874  ORF g.231874 m.231874 type:complete len:59 (+) comp112458_c0_seq1:135-311(+)
MCDHTHGPHIAIHLTPTHAANHAATTTQHQHHHIITIIAPHRIQQLTNHLNVHNNSKR